MNFILNKKLVLFIATVLFCNIGFGRQYVQTYRYEVSKNCIRFTQYTTNINGGVHQSVCVWYQPSSGCTFFKTGIIQPAEVTLENGIIKSTKGQLDNISNDLIKLIQIFDTNYLVSKKLTNTEKDKLMAKHIKSIVSFLGTEKCSVKIEPPKEISQAEIDNNILLSRKQIQDSLDNQTNRNK